MSTPVQLTLQEAFILATGHSANAGQLAWYDAVVARTADYGRIRTVANDYMNDLARERGVVAIVQSVFKNGPGITLSDAETRQLISTGIAEGINTWDKFFEYSITLQNSAGITLNNRAQAAMDFNDSLDAAGKAGHFKGPAVDSAVRNLLQNITSAPASLANGVSGLDALASNLSGTGITTAVFGVGYITGGTVFADANRDGLHSTGEWSATTDRDGKFELPNYISADKIIVASGTGLMTGNPFRAVYSGPAGTTVINTFSTLIEAMVASGQAGSMADATAALRSAMGLPPDINLLSYDPLAVLASSTTSTAEKTLALDVQASAQQITNILTQTEAVIVATTPDSTGILLAFTAVANALASAITAAADTATTIDLSATGVISNVIRQAVNTTGSTLTVKQTAQLAEITAASNTAVGIAANITELSQAVTVSLGSATNALMAAAASGNFDSAVAAFTGAALGAANRAATVGYIDAVVPVPPPPRPEAGDSSAPAAPTALTLATVNDSGISNADKLTKDTGLTISGTAETGATVKLYDTDGTTVLGTGSATGGTFSINVTLTEGVHSISAKATDASNNTGVTSNPLTITVDLTAPGATIVVDDTALNVGDTALVTITFTEVVSGFSNADLTVANGILTNVVTANGGSSWTATFTPTEGTTNASNVITLAKAGVTDLAGNAGVGTTSSNSYAVDTRPPAIAINTIATDDIISALEAGTVISGTNEALATVSLNLGGSNRVPTVTGTTWSYTLVAADLANMGQGAELVTATATGTAGNIATATRRLTVDTLAPTIVGINVVATDDIINAAEAGSVISGTNEAGTSVTLNLGGITRAATVTGTTWSYTLVAADISTMGQGAETLTATATDVAGNSTSVTRAILIDTLAPTFSINVIATDDVINAAEVGSVISGINEAGASVSLSIGGTTRAAVVTGTTWSYTLVVADLANMGQGAETITATATGTAGNSASTTLAITVDTLAPTAAITVIAGDDVISAAEAGSVISGTNAAGASVSLNLGGTVRAATVTGTSWSYTLVAADITTMGQGAETITATAADAAGNTTSATRTIVIDTLAPVVVLNVIATDDVVNTAEVGSIISGINEASASVSVNLGGVTRVATVTGTNWSYTLVAADIANMGQGAETITATVTGKAGNTATATRSITVDTLVPTLALSIVATDDIINAAEAGSVISGSNAAGASVSLNLGGLIRTATVTGTTWSYTLVAADITTMGQGAETITATATDVAGNSASSTRAIVIDTLPPVIAINVIATDDTINAAEAGSVISGTNEAGDTVALSIGGSTRATIVSGTTWSYTLVAADITNMGQGGETLTATATGTAGNIATATRSITVDTLAPAIGVNVVATDDVINLAEAGSVISGTNEAGASVRLNLGGLARTAIVTGTTWSYTLVAADLAAMGQGAETLTATATDTAGNSTSTSRAILIDTLPPVVVINVIATDDVINAAEAGSVITGTTEALATVALDIGGTTRAAIVSGTTWSYTLVAADITNMGQGVETITATATGTAGNTATATRSLTVDTLAPTLALAIVATDDIINAAEAGSVISGTNEAGASVSLNLGGATRVATVTGTSWSYTLVAADITTMGQGAETLTATATDAAGNSASVTRAIVVDTLAPASTINVIATDNVISAAEASSVISGTNEAGASVSLNLGGTTHVAAVTGTTWSYTLVAADITNMGQGAEGITATAADSAGNTSIATRSITVDTLAPTLALAIVATDDIINATEAGSVISGNNEAGASVSLNPGGITRAATVTGTNWSYTLVAADITTMGQGAETLTATATDTAGNSASVTRAILIDTLRPTATIVLADTALKVGETSAVTITFNEAVSGFSNADLTLENGTLSAVGSVDGGITWTATFTPTAEIPDNSNVITLANAGVTDAAGNAGVGTTASNNYAIDTLRPTATIVVADTALKAGEISAVTITFNEAVSGFSNADLTLESGTLSAVNSVDGGTKWTATFTPTADITDTTNAITLANTGITDAAGNAGVGTTASNNYAIDTVRPTATVVVADTALKAGETSGVTITFNEAASGFTNADLTIENGTLSAVGSLDGGITWTATFTPTADLNDTTNAITLANTGVTDGAGNAGVGTTASNNYTIDTLRPTAAIVVADTALKAGETSGVTITFNEAASGFTNADLTLENGTLSAVASLDGGITWTATFTPTADTTDTGNLITLANAGITDAAGNAGTGTTASNNYAIDTLRPTATIVVADTALKAGETSAVTITFNEAASGFTNADLTLENGTLSAVNSVDGGITWTATFTPTADLTDTTNAITLANTGVTDAAGNTGVGTTASNNYAIDTLRPTATIVVADTALKAGETSGVTITFNEAASNFTNADLTIENGTLSAVGSVDGGITWTATFTPTADLTDTTNAITLTNTGVTDAAGNAGVGTTASNNYAVDTLRPTAAIVVADTALKAGETSTVTITFNEAASNFTNADLTLENGTLSAVGSLDGGITWTATFTPTADTTDTSNLITLANAGVTDAAGNAGVGNTSSNNYTIDTQRPTATIVVADTALKAGETSGVTITFNEVASGFTNADLTIENGTLSAVASLDGSITWTATFTPAADLTDTTNAITLTNTGVTDAAGNAGVGTTSSNSYAIDTLRPTATIVVADTALKAGETSAVTITFNEAASNFANADLTIESGTLTAVGSLDGGITWTATFTPTADLTDATNAITLANTGVTDAAGNAGVGTTSSNNYAIDTLRPTATIVVADTALKAGETSGVTITFNEAASGFTNADLTLENGTLSAVGSLDGDITWTATFTPTVDITDTTNAITLANTGVTDAAGSAGVGTTSSNNYAIDTLRPTATIVVADTALKAGETSGVTIAFNEAASGFTNADLTLENGTLSAVGSLDGGLTWTATFTPTVDITDTTNAITLANTGVTDAAGNAGVGTTASNNYAIDTLRPTATIVFTDTALKAGETSGVTITFNEAASNFTNADLTLENGTLSTVGSLDGGLNWTATFTPTADLTDITNAITLANTGVTDAAGNAGVGTTASNNYAIDTLRPTATIVVADTALKAGETSGVTITFNEAASNFTNADLTLENGTLSAVGSLDGGITWTATFTPTAAITDTTNAITLAKTGITDLAGNAGIGSTTSNNYAIDTSVPTLSASTPVDGATAVLVNANIVLTFSENVVAGSGNFVISDGSDIHTIAVGDAKVVISGTSVTLNPSTHLKPNATYSVQMAAGVLVDAAANPYAGITDSTTLNFTTGTDTLTINPDPGNLTVVDSYWTGINGIDKIVITTTATGTQTITSGSNFQTAFVEGAELTTTSSTGTLNLNLSTFTGPARLTTTSTTGNQTIVTGTNADVVTVSTYAATGNSVDTGAGNDRITIVNTGDTNASAYTIKGGLGADVINLDLSKISSDVIVVGDADSGITLTTADSITGFVSAWDSLQLGTAGTAGNLAIAGASSTDFAAALVAANAALATLAAGAEQYSFQWDATNGYLFNDTNGDNAADQVIILVGITGAQIAVADITS